MHYPLDYNKILSNYSEQVRMLQNRQVLEQKEKT